jgi:hypothetical protein
VSERRAQKKRAGERAAGGAEVERRAAQRERAGGYERAEGANAGGRVDLRRVARRAQMRADG